MTAPLRRLAAVFLTTGSLTFGGGGATTAALQRELVERYRWLDRTQFALCYAISRITPGTNLFAFCTCVGSLLGGWRGTVVALLAAAIPATLITLVATAGFAAWSELPAVRAGIEGALAASVGILLFTTWSLVKPHVNRREWPRTLVIVSGSAALVWLLHWPPILALAAAGVAGWLWPEPR